MVRVPSALPLALAVLAVLAAPIAVAAPGAPDATTADTGAQSAVTVVGLSENTSRIVPLPNTERANITTPDASVMASLRMDETDARWTFAKRALAQRLAAAETEAARQRVLRNATDRAIAAVDALLARERAARQAYLDGDLTTEEYVTALAELNGRAERLLQFIGTRSDPPDGSILDRVSPTSPIRDRAYGLLAELKPLRTAPAASATTAVRGGDARRIYVGASPNGFAVSMLTDGRFQRAIYRTDFVDSTYERSINISESQALRAQYYPWAADDGAGFISSGAFIFGEYAYRHRLTHKDGTIFMYLDASSGQPYHEIRDTVLSAVATEPGWTNTSANYTLAVNRSYPGGPLRVSVTHNDTTVDTPVFVAGERVGVTGADGVLWTLAPHGAFNVTVRVGGEDLRVRASTG